MNTKILFALGVAWITAISLPAQAASFDCQKAQLSAEKAVCANRSLSDQDVKLATTFNILTHLLPMGGRDALRDEQHVWLKQRNACGQRTACIATAYQNRQTQLDKLLQERVYSHGPF
ncbi:lysozyme inhibitor LprI family protein [Alkanindiges sp. WGS2144]|uniref:lysozyme inhibitor LprI family protein n=1 Tax=Alkanindiges sp. WGS2144 TaxID=3366808 RepID=UPI0037516B04